MHPFDGLHDFVKPDAPLAPLVWFRLGGHAAYFAKPRTIDELVTVLNRARDAGLPFKILGGGSNILVRDDGVEGPGHPPGEPASSRTSPSRTT